MRVVDLRSDTVTRPTPAMRRAMAEAQVGDDVFVEDPTVKELERTVCGLLGFEAALFVPSGTMANLISVMVHCTARGSEAILGDKSHIHLYEQGGMAAVAGVHPRTVANLDDGTFDLSELEAKVRPDDVHFPSTRLICVENTHNACGGKVLPLSFLDQLVQLASDLGVPLHMDGARLVNAAAALRVSMSRTVRGFSSSTLCLSKSLAAPVGSLIAGSTDFIDQARRVRKVLGGGMRQAGVLAAAGLVALNTMMSRLPEDHRAARTLAEAVNACGTSSIRCDLKGLHSNILLVSINCDLVTPAEFCVLMERVAAGEEEVSVLMLPMGSSSVRMVLHADVSAQDIDSAVRKLMRVVKSLGRP